MTEPYCRPCLVKNQWSFDALADIVQAECAGCGRQVLCAEINDGNKLTVRKTEGGAE